MSSRPVALLVVAAVHGAAVAALWLGKREAAPVAVREAVVKLLPAPTQVLRAAAPLRAAPPLLTLPAVAPIAPPAFEMQAEVRTPIAEPVAAPPAPPVQLAAAAPAPRIETSEEPTLQSARRAACAMAPHPLALRERGIEGVVRLRVWVDELGRAGQVLLANSSGWRLFDDAAVAQARRCPFQPALRGTQPVGSWVEFPVRFALETSNG